MEAAEAVAISLHSEFLVAVVELDRTLRSLEIRELEQVEAEVDMEISRARLNPTYPVAYRRMVEPEGHMVLTVLPEVPALVSSSSHGNGGMQL